MKTTLRSMLLLLMVVIAGAVYGAATVPALDVTVSKPDGKLAFNGKTRANGTFATGNLAPGEYILQFKAKSAEGLKGSQFAIVASAGKQKVSAAGVDGAKFAAGGVAMKVKVAEGTNISGQIANGGGGSLGGEGVKVMNGKRYVWIMPETGSNLGGRWVEEGSPEAKAAGRTGRMSTQDLQKRQDHGDTHQEGSGGH